ncbi:MAG: HD domain-containing protein [Thermodesulfobacteriota bacterium]
MKRKNFRIPNRDIKIEAHELLFINSRCFQRLYKIKQLGLADRVYPFATHTRAAHCLDCLDMSQRFVDALQENLKYSSSLKEEEKNKLLGRIQEDRNLIRAGALLHDIMHIPYSHTLEDENGILEKGDKSERINKMIDRVKKELDELKKMPERANHAAFGFSDQDELEEGIKLAQSLLKDVKKILWTIAFPDEEAMTRYVERKAEKIKYEGGKELSKEEKGELKASIEKNRLDKDRFYIADIIGNTISADLLSYILRDVEYTGIEMRPGFFYRLFDYIELRQNEKTQGSTRLVIKLTKKGDWRHDVLSAIINILNVRFALTEAVIYHHAKCEASAMLGKIASLCNLSESEELYNIGDEGFMDLLENKIGEIEKISKQKAESARQLLHSLESRRFYKRFHIIPASEQKAPGRADLSIVYSFPQKRFDFENRIENKFGLPPGSIILFCPTSKMALKEAEALVVYEKMGSSGNLEEAIEKLNSNECLENLKMRHESLALRVRNVMDQYRALWKLYVFINPSLIPIYGAVLKEEISKPENLRGGDSIFDQYYVSQSNEYEVSEKIKEEARNAVPEPRIPEIYQEIPSAIETLMSKERRGNYYEWVGSRTKEIVLAAKERIEAKGRQGNLIS